MKETLKLFHYILMKMVDLCIIIFVINLFGLEAGIEVTSVCLSSVSYSHQLSSALHKSPTSLCLYMSVV